MFHVNINAAPIGSDSSWVKGLKKEIPGKCFAEPECATVITNRLQTIE